MSLSADVRAYLEGRLQESNEGDKMVRVVQDVLAYLRQHHLLTQMRLPPQYVGVHPSNRDGYGLNALDVHDLIDSVVDVGFVPAKVQAVGVEIEHEDVRKWNENLVASADGLLGVMDGNALKITSLCGSHTNFALRCVAQAVPHENPHISVSGRLSLQLLEERDPAYHNAVVEGLQWDVIAAPVARAFPQLLCLISRSGNTSLARGEHELQVLRRIHGAYTRLAQGGSQPSFAAIKKQVLASKPACANSVPAMFTFCMKASGGTDASLLTETEAYVRAHCPTTRQLGVDLWTALGGDCKGHSAEMVPRFRHAVMKLAYLRQCVSSGDAKKMFAKENFDKVKHADALMTAVRALARDYAGKDLLNNPQIMQALGLHDMVMCALVLGIRLKDEKKYKKVEGISHDFVILLRNITQKPTIPNPWDGHAEHHDQPGTAKSEDATSSTQPMLELSEAGQVRDPAALLEARGFVDGCHVRRKQDKTVGVFVGVKDGKAYIQLECGSHAKVDLSDLLEGEWAIYTPKADAEIITDMSPHSPHVHNDFMAALLIAEMLLELGELEKIHGPAANKFLSLQVKPSKILLAKIAIPKGKLCLVPCTSKIASRHAAGSHEVIGHGWSLDSRKFFLSNSCALPKDADEDMSQSKALLVPFFFVQSTDVIEHANMELQHVKAKGKSFSFPVYKNIGKIEAGEQLLYYKSKSKTVQALEMSPAKRKAPKDSEAAPKKKSKK